MKVIKGFKKDMTCQNFQFREGQTYEEPEADLCHSGFHAVTRPLDAFRYYTPGNSVYHEAELEDVTDQKSEDSKVCGKRITIGARLSIRGLVDAQINYTREHCTNENNAEPGKPATAGDGGAATAGDRGAATAGDGGAATAGYYGAATAGDGGAATAGDRGAATAGDGGVATAGYCGAATAGDGGAATSRGKTSVGENGIACARGNGCMVRGGLGAVLVIAAENEDDSDIAAWKAIFVDGVAIKTDTWYTLRDGELVEAGEGL